jgi:hypothetical protein
LRRAKKKRTGSPSAWDEIQRRAYEPWTDAHLVIDTAQRAVEQSVTELYALLLARERAVR